MKVSRHGQYKTQNADFLFQWQRRDMRLTFFPRALSLGMMHYLSAAFQALYRISCMWILGSTLRPTLWCLSLMVFKMCQSNSDLTLAVLKIMFTTKSFQLKCKFSQKKKLFFSRWAAVWCWRVQSECYRGQWRPPLLCSPLPRRGLCLRHCLGRLWGQQF